MGRDTNMLPAPALPSHTTGQGAAALLSVASLRERDATGMPGGGKGVMQMGIKPKPLGVPTRDAASRLQDLQDMHRAEPKASLLTAAAPFFSMPSMRSVTTMPPSLQAVVASHFSRGSTHTTTTAARGASLSQGGLREGGG